MTYAEGKQLKDKKKTLNSVFSMGEIGKIESINAENKLADHVNAEQRRNRYQQNYMKILKYDYQSQEWIERPAEAAKRSQRRLARKNINENYMAVTGNKVSGLSREEKKKRKSELESRRDVSNKVSLGMADFMENFNWKNDDISEDMITVIKDFDISRLDYASDMEFAENISRNMQVLQSADTLYERLNAGETVPGVKEYEKIDLIFKLERMKDMRTYFEDKARVMSSPYYVSMRDADFTEKTYRNLENIKENEKKPEGLRLYAQSVLRMKENKEKIQRKQIEYDYLKARAQSKKQDNEGNQEKPFDIFGNVINRIGMDEVERTLNYTKKKDGTIGINDYITLKTREWINNDLKSPISAEKFIMTIDTVKNTIIQYQKNHPDENDEASSLLEHMDKVRKAAISGRISPDVARLWLDRSLMGYKALGNRSYKILEAQLKTAENKEYKPESSKVYKDKVNELITNYAQSTNGLKTHLQSNSMVYYIKQDESSRAYTNVATKFFRE
ncbi:MAG: hypothetical protein K6F99_10360, partial [Lachnospiraceae bacterium]|nr:hypothetical protein [Lachnospiraceae bacterium]